MSTYSPFPHLPNTHTMQIILQIILLPLSGHAHLAEPGCLCTKQALGACASKLLENGLGTRRRTSYLLTASGVGTRSPTWTTTVERKGAVICTPAYARYPFTAGWTGGGGGRQRKKIGQYPSASGGARTHDTHTHTCMYRSHNFASSWSLPRQGLSLTIHHFTM